MPKVAFVTLGCKVNQFETTAMVGLFRARGYEEVAPEETADVYVVNTCAVTGSSEKKSGQLIRRVARQNPQGIVAVAGCYAQLNPQKVAATPGVKVVIGTREREKIVDYVEEALRLERDATATILGNLQNARENRLFEDIPLLTPTKRTRAFLKIEDGCDNFCSYCIIPYARGPVRSRSLASIRAETEKLVAVGFKEMVLTGIHLGAYGRDLGGGVSLYDACRAALKVPGLKRLRLGSLESIEVSPSILELMGQDKRLCPHLHLPLQAGSDTILKAMHRHYNTTEYAALLQKIRRVFPNIAISTDVIVGFPGETEELFDETKHFVEQMKFARVHVFPFSPREGTPAAKMSGAVPENIKKVRLKALQEVAAESAQDFARRFLGREVTVLFETTREGISDGLTESYLRVYTADKVTGGEFYPVRLEKLYKDGVWGSLSQ
ncbi:MAG: tRNA (N(6)-L-threonylcarbamoyladenosine(37)-C(2))-methylthiotransferase MtaB [Selenomonadaceae bacterium]|nr:tRNA (N(6)-L-threonylcarbamoyladenosine(37)-C(2))-methylthiotransferase MtaB [Selenomonadaceae bacterium]